MNPMLRGLHKASFDTLRRIKGAFEVMLADARSVQRQAATVREMVAAVEVVHQLEESVAACREALDRKRRQVGWRRPRSLHWSPDPGLCATHAAKPQPCAQTGVAGAEPPAAMGQGRPASHGAGRAARDVSGARDQRAVSVKSAPHPANASFYSENEGISGPSNNEGDIHYAQ